MNGVLNTDLFVSLRKGIIFKTKNPESYAESGFLYQNLGYYTLISTSTPLGNSNFIKASTVFGLAWKMSIKRL